MDLAGIGERVLPNVLPSREPGVRNRLTAAEVSRERRRFPRFISYAMSMISRTPSRRRWPRRADQLAGPPRSAAKLVAFAPRSSYRSKWGMMRMRRSAPLRTSYLNVRSRLHFRTEPHPKKTSSASKQREVSFVQGERERRSNLNPDPQRGPQGEGDAEASLSFHQTADEVRVQR